MGNCLFNDPLGEDAGISTTIKVVTFNGAVLELHPPVTAECITNGFPGHGIFRGHDLFSNPLLHTDHLCPGDIYYLRPLAGPRGPIPSLVAPYRVSFDHHGPWWRHDTDMLAKCHGRGGGGGAGTGAGGVWKVKLVIRPAELSEILAQESRMEALVESMRTVAKCGNGAAAAAVATSAASSDQWSLAGSRKACSENMNVNLG